MLNGAMVKISVYEVSNKVQCWPTEQHFCFCSLETYSNLHVGTLYDYRHNVSSKVTPY